MARGRKKRHGPTVHGMRLHWLILQLMKDGVTQSDLARRTGLGVTLLNKYRNIDSSGVSGISAETVQAMRDKVGVDPRYFFDPYDGERPHSLYLLDAKREAAQLADTNQRVAELTRKLADSERKNADLEREFGRRIAALENANMRPRTTSRTRTSR